MLKKDSVFLCVFLFQILQKLRPYNKVAQTLHLDRSTILGGGGGVLCIFLRNLHIFFCTCHNFPPLSSVQIIIIPACCLLCVL